MPAFPAYVCLALDKLLCSFVVAGGSFTNDTAVKDRAVGAFDLEPYRRASKAFTKTLEAFKECVDCNKGWDNYPPFLKDMYEGSNKKTKIAAAEESALANNTNGGGGNQRGNGNRDRNNDRNGGSGFNGGRGNGGDNTNGTGGNDGRNDRRNCGSYGGNGFGNRPGVEVRAVSTRNY